ncbi:Flavodoxin [Methanobrevibacter gottschalkii]|uniref:Flavodoxin n=2 Tax=Methanobrevibacter gottschalkii TaxID=190974 RepID=A0A3N5B2V3_9EURY|nr:MULTISPECIES: flavodoxin [Methanobrevibacter]MCQ2970211.1 flavodoxin [archaeon]OEC94614.1 flavodoxin [Methanobrevibacter sp. A27]RPF51976.1 flavodoxin [Methanobrevibacter gottschalkii DSM 11977]SEL41874.1 Flavodoxin [Methanobrevibacter gottschalkii]
MSDLIIYFSRDGENYFSGEIKSIEKGNTEVIAEYIQEFTGADIFKVIPKKDYPSDYMKCIDIAKKELKANARPEIKEELSDISDYDIIYIGFPNWWGTLPMPMWTQLEKLDFTGKVIKPFVTHEGSRFGKSGKDLKRLCKDAIIKKGLSISGSDVYDLADIVKIWLEE